MPLMTCPDCKHIHSDAAPHCPACARPSTRTQAALTKPVGLAVLALVVAGLAFVGTKIITHHDAVPSPSATTPTTPTTTQIDAQRAAARSGAIKICDDHMNYVGDFAAFDAWMLGTAVPDAKRYAVVDPSLIPFRDAVVKWATSSHALQVAYEGTTTQAQVTQDNLNQRDFLAECRALEG